MFVQAERRRLFARRRLINDLAAAAAAHRAASQRGGGGATRLEDGDLLADCRRFGGGSRIGEQRRARQIN